MVGRLPYIQTAAPFPAHHAWPKDQVKARMAVRHRSNVEPLLGLGSVVGLVPKRELVGEDWSIFR